MINWLTWTEIHDAAEAGRKEAFLNCEHHWWQFCQITLDEYKACPLTIYCDDCALCLRYRLIDIYKDEDIWSADCRSCKLNCIHVWGQVRHAVENDDPEHWAIATKAMHAHIVEKIHRLYPNLTIPKHKD